MSLSNTEGNIGVQEFSFANKKAQILANGAKGYLHPFSYLRGRQALQKICTSIVTTSHCSSAG
jgi:hypothetical protein